MNGKNVEKTEWDEMKWNIYQYNIKVFIFVGPNSKINNLISKSTLSLENNIKSEEIQVSIISKSYTTSTNNNGKVFSILNAHTMTSQAMNNLLKLLRLSKINLNVMWHTLFL